MRHPRSVLSSGNPTALERLLHYVAFAAILTLGVYLRVAPIAGTTPEQIITGGDAREYIQLAEFFLDPDLVPPGNKFPGYSFLLVALFVVMPFSHEAISVATCLVLSVVSLGMSWLLAKRVVGSRAGLIVTALVATHPGIVHNAHRGLSEELFLVLFLTILLLYLVLRDRASVPLTAYAVLAGLGGYMSVVRPDAAYAMIPIAGMLLWGEKSRTGRLVPALAKVAPILILPFLLPKLSQAWMMSLGVQDLDLRVGRAGVWMEFMIGRMPYQYMFYKERTTAEWFLGHHTYFELVVIAVKSVVRNLLALGKQVGGQVALLLATAGALIYLRQRREWALPLAVPLAMLLQWGLMALWPDVDVMRYNFRIVPLVFLFLVFGADEIASWLGRQLPAGERMKQWLPAIVLVVALFPALLPFSLYEHVRPMVDILMRERTEFLPKVSQVHADLTSTWTQMASQRLSLEDATAAVRELRERHSEYAPTHFVLGVLYLQQGQRVAAIASLEQAVETIPFFAEAAVLLAELYYMEERREDALLLLERTQSLRTDYPLIVLLRGHLKASGNDANGARAAYEEYIRLNEYQHDRAFVRNERVLKRLGDTQQQDQLRQFRDTLQADARGLTSPFVWSYLSLDLDGIAMPRPADQTLYFNLGVCDLLAGDNEAAQRHWTTMTRLVPNYADAWANLGILQASQGRHDQARENWQQALALEPDHALVLQAQRQLEIGNLDASTALYAPIEIVLPMTHKRL